MLITLKKCAILWFKWITYCHLLLGSFWLSILLSHSLRPQKVVSLVPKTIVVFLNLWPRQLRHLQQQVGDTLKYRLPISLGIPRWLLQVPVRYLGYSFGGHNPTLSRSGIFEWKHRSLSHLSTSEMDSTLESLNPQNEELEVRRRESLLCLTSNSYVKCCFVLLKLECCSFVTSRLLDSRPCPHLFLLPKRNSKVIKPSLFFYVLVR